MAVRELDNRPDVLSHFPDTGKYRWLALYSGAMTYGYSAIAESDEILELHLTLIRWGANVRRSVADDVQWLQAEARRLGKRKIMGVRVDDQGKFDERLFKFAGLFGFTEMHTFQTATLYVD